RSRTHASEIPDGAAREADRGAAPLPSQGADVDVTAELHRRVDGGVSRHYEGPARLAHGRGARPAGQADAPQAPGPDSGTVPDSNVLGHHAQPAGAVSHTGLGPGVRPDARA